MNSKYKEIEITLTENQLCAIEDGDLVGLIKGLVVLINRNIYGGDGAVLIDQYTSRATGKDLIKIKIYENKEQ
jgi:hypothetical protein